MSCACARVLRSTTSSACARLRFVETAAAQEPHPAEDRVQRRAQLVRNGGDELVLAAAQRFGFAARILLALEQRLTPALGLAPIRRVAEHEHDADEPAVGARESAPRCPRWAFRGRRARAAACDWRARRCAPRGTPCARDSRRGCRVSSSTMLKTVSMGLPTRGRFAPARQRLRDRIQQRDVAGRVGSDDGVADASQRHGEPRFVLLARRARATRSATSA